VSPAKPSSLSAGPRIPQKFIEEFNCRRQNPHVISFINNLCTDGTLPIMLKKDCYFCRLKINHISTVDVCEFIAKVIGTGANTAIVTKIHIKTPTLPFSNIFFDSGHNLGQGHTCKKDRHKVQYVHNPA
jgi:hypothetical protein